MTEKFRNKYRVRTTRLNGYDYTRDGAYFITVCTRKHICYFGDIVVDKMILSETGEIVYKNWIEIQNHFHNIYLDEFVIMPDHLHGIIIIKSTTDFLSVETPNLGVSLVLPNKTENSETPRLGVSTSASQTFGKSLMPRKSGNPYWKSNSIGSIVNQFKRICTINTKSLGFDLTWQPRYYDHIIRSDNELYRIRTYIRSNPNNWLNDK